VKRRSRRRRTIAIVIVAGAAVAGGLAFAGCAMTIVPPSDPVEPTTIFVVDYGRHSSLLLPRAGNDGLDEYAYGDWAWFALDRSSTLNLLPTLFLPTRGTLGHAVWMVEADADAIRAARDVELVIPVIVETEKAAALHRRLDERFDAARDTLHWQPRYGLDFVHDPTSYHVFHNCNQVTASWLRELGCEVRGCTMFSAFDYVAPSGSSANTTGTASDVIAARCRVSHASASSVNRPTARPPS
jgi:hypothetical protein